MGACVIFCAGEFSGLQIPIQEDDYVIAADGGLAYLQAMDISPHETLGDFDSLGYTPENATVFPEEKDDTDAMLAVRRGLCLGYREFFLYGGLDGPRLDHTVANLQTLEFLSRQGAAGWLVGTTHIATVIRGERLTFSPQMNGIVSVFCMGEDARGVEISGLKYELRDATLTAGFPLGVSNRFLGKESSIAVREGSLLVIFQREKGRCLPDRRANA